MAWWTKESRFEHLQVTEDQLKIIQALSEYFISFDTDYSGELEPAEHRLLYDALLEQGYRLEGFEAVQAAVDKSGDGTINFNEWLSFMIAQGVLDMSF